ncbi:hypothetical protein QYF48_16110 [Brevibacillus agri]|uniref:hypothetical protein n=1 Tax=Brevibacillus agri TaxID=51101 RepID=UPI0025B6ADB4|nr:hypothetical protein [Brevibacillus agri]MDN4094333.1 hypothetical protein [Brevibacillus agri]
MLTVFALAFNDGIQHEIQHYICLNHVYVAKEMLYIRDWHDLEQLTIEMEEMGADALLLESANSFMSKSDYEDFLKYAAANRVYLLFADEENKKARNKQEKEKQLTKLRCQGLIDDEQYVTLMKKIEDSDTNYELDERNNVAVILCDETEEQMSIILDSLNSNLLFYPKSSIDTLEKIVSNDEINEVYIKNSTAFESAGELATTLFILTEDGKRVHLVDQDITVDKELAMKMVRLFEYY